MTAPTDFIAPFCKKAGDNITNKLDLKSMSSQALSKLLEDLGQPKFRALQLFKWLQSGVDSFDEMTNIPLSLRKELNELGYIATVKPVRKYVSKIDGTVKYVYELFDGELIESVLMKYNYGNTICVSTQVGCKMGCKFCASTKEGFERSLLASEIEGELLTVERYTGEKISNVVYMGTEIQTAASV